MKMNSFRPKKKRPLKKYVSSILFGEQNKFDLEQKVFIVTTSITLLASIVGLVWNVFLGLPSILNIVVGIAIMIFSVLLYNSRYKNKYLPILFVCTALIFLSLLFFLNGGVTGSIPAIFIVFLAVSISMSNSKYHRLILIFTTLNLLLLIIAENSFLKGLVIPYDTVKAQELDLSFGYISGLLCCYLLIKYFKDSITRKNIELQKTNASKDLLFSIIAHDLRAPFNNVIGFTEIMIDKTENISTEKYQTYSEIVNKESKKACEHLDSLLEWRSVLTNNFQLSPQKHDLHQISSEIAEVFKPKCLAKKIDLRIKVPKETYVFSDLVSIKTILRNLVSNATKFTSHGGAINISIDDYSANYLYILIEDNGIGMNQETIDNLFNYKVKTNRTGTDGETSIGLGLIICKELIEKQGDELKIESELNKGSIFKFRIPKT